MNDLCCNNSRKEENQKEDFELTANTYYETGDVESAVDAYFQAAEYYEKEGDERALSRVLERIEELLEDIYYPKYYPEHAETSRIRLIEFYTKQFERGSGTYDLLGNQQYLLWKFYFFSGRLGESQKAAFEIFRTNKRYNKKLGAHPFLNAIDKTLVRIYKQSSSLSFSEPYSDMGCKRYETIARKYPLLYMKRLADYYLSQGVKLANSGNETEKAEELFLKAISKYKKSYDDTYETPPSILTAYQNLAILYEQKDRYDKSLRMWRQALRYSRQFAQWDENYLGRVHFFQSAVEKTKTKIG